ncbi:SDR family oxidoreductase [Exiguobacterium indicum]|uniref:SDR family NAD(P)-dependent oxidoreductase n=1 Tax=Exiguobacterium indicum TaxID=296995 RepID=UPI003982A8CC
MHVLITGASRGLGREFAYLHARQGDHVLLVGRDATALFETKFHVERLGGTATVFPYDLTQRSHRLALFRATEQIPVDCVINNAGIGVFGSFLETSFEDESRMIALNIEALTHVTKIYASRMKEQGIKGRIVHLASTAAFEGGPWLSVYYATKAYVLHFSEGLTEELAVDGIQVSVVCPGATHTGFESAANLEQSRLFLRPGVMDAPTVARIAYRGYMKGKTFIVPGFGNAWYIFSTRFLPRRYVTRQAGEVQRPR